MQSRYKGEIPPPLSLTLGVLSGVRMHAPLYAQGAGTVTETKRGENDSSPADDGGVHNGSRLIRLCASYVDVVKADCKSLVRAPRSII